MTLIWSSVKCQNFKKTNVKCQNFKNANVKMSMSLSKSQIFSMSMSGFPKPMSNVKISESPISNVKLWFTRALALSFLPLPLVADWSKVLTAVPWPFMVWFTLALGTYQLRFLSWVFHVIFSFVHFISLYTLGGLRAFRIPLPIICIYSICRIANHILVIKICFSNG